MSPQQVEGLYLAHRRDEYGRLQLPPVTIGKPMSDRQRFEYGCFLLSIRDKETVAKLWAEEQAKLSQMNGKG